MTKNGLDLDQSFEMSSISHMLLNLAEHRIDELVGDVEEEPELKDELKWIFIWTALVTSSVLFSVTVLLGCQCYQK